MTEIVAAHLERAEELIQQWVAAGLSLEDLEVRVAAALAACAREADHAALERVVYMLQSMQIDSVPNLVDRGRVIDCVRALERAAGESK